MAASSIYDITIGMAVDQREMTRAVQKQEAVLKKVYSSALSSATEAGFSRRKLAGLEATMVAASKKMSSTQMEIMRLGEKLKKGGLDSELKARTKHLLDEQKAQRGFLKEQAKEHLKSTKAAAVAYQKEIKKHEARVGRGKDALGAASRWQKGSKGAAGGLRDMLGQFASGDVSGMAQTAGKGGKAFKGALENKVKRGGVGAGAAGGALKGIEKLMGAIGKLGIAMAAIGAVVGILAVLVKVFLDADKMVKEMNASLLKSNVVAADLGGHWRDLEDRIGETRGAFQDFSFMNAWKILPKEAMKIVDAYGAAGVKVSQFTDGLKTAEQRQEKLRKITEVALTYAKLVGMTGEEVATKMGEYMDNLGQSLTTVKEGFSSIYRVASESGYSTKKFFGMVLQATSGLTMYNVRLEQTASLLKDLTGALGLKDGFALLQKLLGGMKGKSITDRAKDITASSGGLAKRRRRFKEEAEHQAKTFLELMRAGKAGTMFEGAAANVGVKLDTTSAKGLLASLKKMSTEDFNKLSGELTAQAKTKEQKDLVKGLKDMRLVLVKGLKGGVLDIAGAESATGPVYKLMAEFDRLKKAAELGGGSLSDMSSEAKVVAEKLGFSEDQMLGLMKVYQDLTSKMGHMERARDKVKTEADMPSGAELREMVEQFGATLEWNKDTGKAEIKKATMGNFGEIVAGKDPISSLSDWLYANEEVLKKVGGVGDSQELAQAKLIATQTTEATKILGGIKDVLLDKLYVGVMSIYTWLKSDQTSEADKVMGNSLGGIAKQSQGHLTALSAEKAEVQQMLGRTKADSPERAALTGALTKLVDEEKVAGARDKAIAERMQAVGKFATDQPKKWEALIKAIGDDQGKIWGDWGDMNEDTKEQLLKVIALGAGGGEQTTAALQGTGLKLDAIEGVSVAPTYSREKYRKSGSRKQGTDQYGYRDVVSGSKLVVEDPKALAYSKGVRARLKSEAEARARLQVTATKGDGERIVKAQTNSQIMQAQMLAALQKSGVSTGSTGGDKALARELASGTFSESRMGELKANPELARKLLGIEGLPPQSKELIEKSLRKPAADDMVLGVSGGVVNFARRVHDTDIPIGKPNGVLAQAASRGGNNITNNFWEGKSAFASVRDWEKAKGQFA